MKTVCALTASILLAGIFFCQGQDATNSAPKTPPETDAGESAPSFDGDWRGPVKWVGGEDPNMKCKLRIVIHGDTALAYSRQDNKWAEIADESSGCVKYTVSKMHNICVVSWLKKNPAGGWTEEQTYSLSYINPSKVKVLQLRHVSNGDEGKNGTSWFYVRMGTLTKTN
jgi:hypothetical protein